MIKYKWKIQAAPTGTYRSFFHRGWPQAWLPDGTLIGHIFCEDDYRPAAIKSGNHPPLTIRFFDVSAGVQKRRPMKYPKQADTLDAAKTLFAALVKKHPEFFTLPK